jgi:hypothetical protein
MFQGGVGAKREQMTVGFYPNPYWWWPVYRKRDYVRAERFWSPNYIQHSAHIASGREGLFDLIKSIPPTLKYEPGMIVAEGDLVMIHERFSGFGQPTAWIAALAISASSSKRGQTSALYLMVPLPPEGMNIDDGNTAPQLGQNAGGLTPATSRMIVTRSNGGKRLKPRRTRLDQERSSQVRCSYRVAAETPGSAREGGDSYPEARQLAASAAGRTGALAIQGRIAAAPL